VLAAAYLWATVFGKGIHGLKLAPELDYADSYPDADVALIMATAFYVGGAALPSGSAGRSRRLGRGAGSSSPPSSAASCSSSACLSSSC
jgi:hypothetical protein